MKKIELTVDDIDEGIYTISLVKDPAIQVDFFAFGKQSKRYEFNEEQRVCSGLFMIPDLEMPRQNDETGEIYAVWFSAETIKKIVLKSFKNKNTLPSNPEHKPQLLDGVYLFESYIIDRNLGKVPPTQFENAPDGSWFGSYKIDNDEVWQQVKAGKFKGFSVEGIFGLKESFNGIKYKELVDMFYKK